jgi:3-deoxy-7-phosphoheptulonate synthase
MVFLAEMYLEKGLENPFVIVDVNHSNSQKVFSEQPRIIKEVLHSRNLNNTIHSLVRGVMIESFIEEGSQNTNGSVYGKSITDACLGWDDTENLLLYMAEHV